MTCQNESDRRAVRVGDELRFTGKVAKVYPDGLVSIRFDGANIADYNLLSQAALASAERLPHKLAVGDRVVHRANDKPKPVGVIRHIDPDDWAALVWDHGPRGWYPLSDLRLSDDGAGK